MQIIALGFEIWTRDVTCPTCNSRLRIDHTDIHKHFNLRTDPPTDYYAICSPCRRYRRETTLIPLANDVVPDHIKIAALLNNIENL